MRFASCCLLAAALAACESGIDDTAEAMDMRDLRNTTLTVNGDCLAEVWPKDRAQDRTFDRAHDAVEGGSLSCATGTTPREFDAALETMRVAALKKDRRALLASINAPLLFIDAAGKRSNLAGRADIEREQARVLTDDLLAALARMSIDKVTVVPDQGAFFDLGAVWIASRDESGVPRVVTINLQALEEANAAAR